MPENAKKVHFANHAIEPHWKFKCLNVLNMSKTLEHLNKCLNVSDD